MGFFSDISSLIKEEQKKTEGKFISLDFDLHNYLTKIENKSEIICHVEAGVLVGFVAFYCNDYLTKRAFITLVLVAESGRGKGIANNLLSSALSIMKARSFATCELEVKENNINAIALYNKLGFKLASKKADKNLILQVSL